MFPDFGDGLGSTAAWRGDPIIAKLIGQSTCSSTGSGEEVSDLTACKGDIAIALLKQSCLLQWEDEDKNENEDIFDVFVQGGFANMNDFSIDVL